MLEIAGCFIVAIGAIYLGLVTLAAIVVFFTAD